MTETRSLTDSCGRELRYLRISVTDRCNLRCRYCMPPQGIPLLRHQDILTYEEIAAVARAAARLGVTSVRITGGEPLVRRDLVKLVAMLREIRGLHDLSMTTNGALLAPAARALAGAGLDRVNVSVDSLDPARYAAITRGGDLADALAGIEAALEAGLRPVKINAVMLSAKCDGGLRRWMEPFVELARSLPVHVRFIERMPVGPMPASGHRGAEAVEIMRALGAMPADHVVTGAGPARYWRLDGAPGSVGLIAPMSDPFCHRCNRLRLTARGELRTCIFAAPEVDLQPLLRPRVRFDALVGSLRRAWLGKPAARGASALDAPARAHSAHSTSSFDCAQDRSGQAGQARQAGQASMCQIGG